jgi:hypothetical protein
MPLLHSGFARRLLPNVRPFQIPCAIPLMHGGSSLCGRKPVSSGTHHCPSSVSSAFGGALRLDTGPCAASSVLQKISLYPVP